MDFGRFFDIFLYVLLPGIISVSGYLIKNLMNRIQDLESQLLTKMSEDRVRLLLQDKIEPIKEDLKDIKDTVNKLYELQIKRNDHGER